MGFIKGVFTLLLTVAVFGLIAAAVGWIWLQNELAKPGPFLADTTVVVASGEGLNATAARLEADGLISNKLAFRAHARFQGQETAIKAGEYIVPARATMYDVLEVLVDGKAVNYKITIPEGRTTAQALAIIAASDILTGDMPDTLPGEGELLPDTYLFARGTTRAQMIEIMVKGQDDLIAELWPKRQSGLPVNTPSDAIILASVVEKETGIAEERPEIAALFTTRLKRGMRLESDPTIIYGVSRGEPLMNARGERRTLYRSEIDRKTDWNTYQIDGLPKTPICNPGRDAIAAVLNPPETDYIFFVADGKGGHLFAKTLAEHNRNVAAYRKYEREEIARERSN